MLISFEQAFSWLKFAYAILLLVDLLFLTSYWMMYLDIDDMEEEIEEEEEASTFQAGDGKVFTDRLVFLFFVLIQGYIYKKYCGLWGGEDGRWGKNTGIGKKCKREERKRPEGCIKTG